MGLDLPSQDCWPTPLQLDLLRAGVVRDERAIASWQRFRNAAARHPAHDRILPLALWNLRSLTGCGDLTGLRPDPLQLSWTRNRRLLDDVLPVLRALREADVPVVLCKGLALAATVYPSLALRPIGDVDLLVGPDALARAGAVLRDGGWRPVEPRAASAMPHLHSFGFAHSGGASIDLHATALYECAHRGFDDGFWKRRVPLAVRDLEASTLAACDHLLLLCVHGLRFSRQPAVHWLADAALLLRTAGDTLDWSVLLEETRRRQLEAPVLAALELLRAELDAPVPEVVHRTLTPGARRWPQRLELRARTRPPTLPGGLFLHWRDYRRPRRLVVGPRGPLGFLRYLQELWGLPRLVDLPRAALRKGWSRLRGAA
jgi:hypothetical protein